MKTSFRTAAHRRYSLGGPLPAPETIEVWKFDAVLQTPERQTVATTCYVRCAIRGDAFRALFAAWPEACILGTGMPLTIAQFAAEHSHNLKFGEVLCFDNLGQVCRAINSVLPNNGR